MKKNKKIGLSLNKKVISNFKNDKINGGGASGWDPGVYCYTVPCTAPTIGFCNTAACGPQTHYDCNKR